MTRTSLRAKSLGIALAAAIMLALVMPPASAQAVQPTVRPLTFDELVALSETDRLAPPLKEKLEEVLRSPIVNNEAAPSGARPPRPLTDGLGPVLRTAFWNIERGQEFDLIRLAFSDVDEFRRAIALRGTVDPRKLASIEHQVDTLRNADVIILNEVDLGMKRTDYRDVAKELAHE